MCEYVFPMNMSATTVRSLSEKFEPKHGKTNKIICAPSKDSDQPGHPLV